ncbi:hypothetical protein ACFWFZ_33815 [Streptomyces sp. NPDC060232]|uniref:hypothetical protein n=1 Tax=Streptomyces sp. NPDC060232 TaxID=3347079 RepID=UPI003660D4FD
MKAEQPTVQLLGRCSHAARIAQRQARILGSLQYPLVHGDDQAAAAQLRHLAPTYAQLRTAINAGLSNASRTE